MTSIQNQRLFTPGPMALENSVKQAMMFDLGSRTAEFRDITKSVHTKLLSVADACNTHKLVMLPGSGTTMIEAVLASFLGPDHKIMVCINGIYGQRALEMMHTMGLATLAIHQDPGKPVCPESVRAAIKENPEITHLYFVHVETTFGVMNPYSALLQLGKEHGLKTIVDSMSAFGAADISGKRDGFDILIASGNKCLEAPPGVTMAFISKCFLRSNHVVPKTYALDLKRQLETFEKTWEWRFTPPTHVVQALDESLSRLVKEGPKNRLERYSRIAKDLIEQLRPLGFFPLVSSEARFPNCVCFVSATIQRDEDYQEFCALLRTSNLYVYAALESVTRSFRIGCIGAIEHSWIDALVNDSRRFVQHKRMHAGGAGVAI